MNNLARLGRLEWLGCKSRCDLPYVPLLRRGYMGKSFGDMEPQPPQPPQPPARAGDTGRGAGSGAGRATARAGRARGADCGAGRGAGDGAAALRGCDRHVGDTGEPNVG